MKNFTMIVESYHSFSLLKLLWYWISGLTHIRVLQVKALYVKNIPENTSIEQLKELFQQHGEVTKVIMPPAKSGGKRDFGFVHYAERSSALKAIKETEKYDINGTFWVYFESDKL